MSDALFLLADQGFEIIIPEVVALEAGNILRNHQPLDSIFDKKNTSRRMQFSEITRPFFEKLRAVSEQNPDYAMHIMPTPASSTLAGARDANAIYDIYSDNHLTDDQKRAQIAAIHATKTREKDAGELSVIEAMQAQQTDVPVFYLSDDFPSLQEVRAAQYQAPINILGSGALYNALRESKLLPLIGVQNFDFKVVAKKMISPIDEGREKSPRTYDNFAMLLDKGLHQNVMDTDTKPFTQAVATLAADLKKQAGEQKSAEKKKLNQTQGNNTNIKVPAEHTGMAALQPEEQGRARGTN